MTRTEEAAEEAGLCRHGVFMSEPIQKLTQLAREACQRRECGVAPSWC